MEGGVGIVVSPSRFRCSTNDATKRNKVLISYNFFVYVRTAPSFIIYVILPENSYVELSIRHVNTIKLA